MPDIPILSSLVAVIPILAARLGVIATMLKPSSLTAGIKLPRRNNLATVVAVAVIVGVWHGVPQLGRALGAPAGAAQAADAEWPAFRGGMNRRGATLDASPDPTLPGNIWAFAHDVKTFYASPALRGNRVYISSADKRPFSDCGAIYCLDADTGAVIWKHSPPDFRATVSSPSVSGAFLVCGEGLHYTTDARITCLRLDGDSYEPLWEFRTQSHVESSPCIHEDKVYIGAGDDGLYCIALEPTPQGDADVIWHLKDETFLDCEASPAVAAGRVYAGLGMGGKAVVCADAATGSVLWRRPAPYPVFGCATVIDGKVFVGMGNGNFVETAEEVRTTELARLEQEGASRAELAAASETLGPAGEAWCLDAADGGVLWTHKLARTVLGAMPEDNGRLYVGDRSGSVTCLSCADGSVLATWAAHEPIIASPAVAKAHLYVITETGRLFCLDKQSLRRIWDAPVGTGGAYLSSPAIGRGHVYVGTSQDGLVCLGQPDTGEKTEMWAGPLGGPGRSGWNDRSPLPARARFVWRYPEEDADDADASATTLAAPVAAAHGAVYALFKGGRTGLARLALSENRRQAPEEAWFYETSTPATDSVVIVGDRVLIADGSDEGARQLHCIDAATGAVNWKREVRGGSCEMVATEHAVYIFDGTNALSCVPIGHAEEGWTTRIQDPVGAPCPAESVLFVASASEVACLSSANGSVLWRAPLTSPALNGPVTVGRTVVVATAGGVLALDTGTGTPLWDVVCAKIAAPLVCNGDVLAVTTSGGEFVVLDWSGKEKLRIDGAVPGLPPMLVGKSLLYFTKSGASVVDLLTGESRSWLSHTSWLGDVTTPAIMLDSHLYYGTSKKALVCVAPR